ncbi:DUF983 domain-containing protein [Flexithrix dorotheae]|uniref:DUF983 domain-containing protein n=1 Tax=Flexithrix dorotheae TaxID=70993 RepID=UPI000378E714|nr:DUF983 domain-containing protein [Flexithrix dorotheae]
MEYSAKQEKSIGKFGAIITCKCPNCRQGDMFQYSLLGNLPKFNKLHDTCPKCSYSFHPEPGFYYGAMYFSYGFNVAIMVSIFIIAQIFFQPTLIQLLIAVIVPTILFVPVNFRLSRALMLHLFGNLDATDRK